MGRSPTTQNRAMWLSEIAHVNLKTYMTIEPIMDFDMDEMVYLIETCLPKQVNIGADTGRNDLPEPTPEKIAELISRLSEFTTVKQKTNLKRLMI